MFLCLKINELVLSETKMQPKYSQNIVLVLFNEMQRKVYMYTQTSKNTINKIQVPTDHYLTNFSYCPIPLQSSTCIANFLEQLPTIRHYSNAMSFYGERRRGWDSPVILIYIHVCTVHV